MEAMAAMSGPAAILDIDGTLVDSNYGPPQALEVDDQRRCTAPAAVYESIDELRRRLSDTPLG